MSGEKIVNCWNSIGVWGREQPRCALLRELVHCHNCEKYISAGKAALQRNQYADYLRQWTSQAASNRAAAGGGKSLLVFRIGDRWLGIDTGYLAEICAERRIRSLPKVSTAVIKGLVNISGKVQLCFSLGQLLRIEKRETQRLRRQSLYDPLVVAIWNSRKYVFPVNEVYGICSHLPDSEHGDEIAAAGAVPPFVADVITHDGMQVQCLDALAVFSELDRSLAQHG